MNGIYFGSDFQIIDLNFVDYKNRITVFVTTDYINDLPEIFPGKDL